MGYFGKIAGGVLGFMVGGPLGAIAGAGLGHGLIDLRTRTEESVEVVCPHCQEEVFIPGGGNYNCPYCNNDFTFIEVVCPHCQEEVFIPGGGNYNCPYCNNDFTFGEVPETEEQFQYVFFLATFSLLAKLCKVDGKVSKEEIKTVDDFMINELELNNESLDMAKNIFREAKDSNHSYEEYAEQFFTLFQDNTEMLEFMLQLLLKVAFSDGYFHKNEDKMLADIAHIFSFSKSDYEQFKGVFIEDKNKYYTVLGCTESDSIDTIKLKYRQLVKDYHPDKISSKGLPTDFMVFAESKFKEIQTAYEFILHERLP